MSGHPSRIATETAHVMPEDDSPAVPSQANTAVTTDGFKRDGVEGGVAQQQSGDNTAGTTSEGGATPKKGDKSVKIAEQQHQQQQPQGGSGGGIRGVFDRLKKGGADDMAEGQEKAKKDTAE